jgi:G:T-mismatch repair DNA endonuclease (very short patch repair protein)
LPQAHHLDEETARIAALAYDAGYVIKSLESFREDLGAAIATRMRTRSRKYMWQTSSFSVHDFPREALLSLPEGLKTQDSPNLLQYNADSMAQVEELAASILRCTKSVRGLTRLLKKPSEPAARLVATLSALTLTWKKPQQLRSRPALVVDLQFVISTQHGEVHPPKDSSRREMHVSDAIMTMWRRKILADIKLHAEMGSRLAAGYWRQVGNFEMARQVDAGGEARLKRVRKATPAPRRVRWTPAARFEVDAILEMREEAAGKMLKVRWAGYHPSWEVFRQEGEGKRGDPVLTWEPEAEMLHTDAYKEWLERSAASRA